MTCCLEDDALLLEDLLPPFCGVTFDAMISYCYKKDLILVTTEEKKKEKKKGREIGAGKKQFIVEKIAHDHLLFQVISSLPLQ